MKVLLDQNVYFELAALLCRAGFEAQHARELGLSRTPDDEIIRFAAQHGFIVVTHDEDFHALLALSGAVQPSVIRMRIMLPVREMSQLVADTLLACEAALNAGAAVSVDGRGARIHRLPIG